MRTYWVYILASHSRVLYTGVTSNLRKRLLQHRNKTYDGFTAEYAVTRLVHFEAFENVYAALTREKEIKGIRREKKVQLIERINAGWHDLSTGWFTEPAPGHEPLGEKVPPRRFAPRSG